MNKTHCIAITASGALCKGKPNASGYCPKHDPARKTASDKSNQSKNRFNEVIKTVLRTVKAKGWNGKLFNKDTKTWKYASVNVERWTGASWVKGSFDITVDNGVKVSMQELTPFNPHGLSDLDEAIIQELGLLPWLTPHKKEKSMDVSPRTKVEHLLKRFHKVALQLRSRHENRNTLMIHDEYDVQDLLHALLCVFFDDIRPEEYTPSKGGGSARIDFLLKNEKIVVEAKMANQKFKDKQIGDELFIDIKRYQAHPDCNFLICFVYDPEGFLKNPAGLSADISRKHDKLDVKLLVGPEH
jgi:hypothetical protein